MNNPIKSLDRRERILWISSLLIVFLSNILNANFDFLTLMASLVGVTALIFAAKGNVWAQILTIVFSILYGIISFRFHYWGEMITYLGMTLPMAVWSAYTWIKNPSAENENQVEIRSLNKKQTAALGTGSIIVTFVFYVILRLLHTPNILFSTISVLTSFTAAALTMMRSSFYALGYAANDIALIVLWSAASAENPVYIPVVVIFVIFFVNDIYGFSSWRKRELQQKRKGPAVLP